MDFSSLPQKNLSEVNSVGTFTFIGATPPWAPFWVPHLAGVCVGMNLGSFGTSQWDGTGSRTQNIAPAMTWNSIYFKTTLLCRNSVPKSTPALGHPTSHPGNALEPRELQKRGICCCCSRKGDPGWSQLEFGAIPNSPSATVGGRGGGIGNVLPQLQNVHPGVPGTRNTAGAARSRRLCPIPKFPWKRGINDQRLLHPQWVAGLREAQKPQK